MARPGEKVITGTCASGSTGNIFWRDGIYAETEQQQAGTMQVSYYDAQTGTQLCTGSIAHHTAHEHTDKALEKPLDKTPFCGMI